MMRLGVYLLLQSIVIITIWRTLYSGQVLERKKKMGKQSWFSRFVWNRMEDFSSQYSSWFFEELKIGFWAQQNQGYDGKGIENYR